MPCLLIRLAFRHAGHTMCYELYSRTAQCIRRLLCSVRVLQQDCPGARMPYHVLREVQHDCPQTCCTSFRLSRTCRYASFRLCRLIAFCTQRENRRRILEMLLYQRWQHPRHHWHCPRPHHCSSVPGARSVSRRNRLWSFTRGESSPVYPRAFPGIIARLATRLLMWRPICSSTNAARNT